jgi:5'-3' exonuclease
MKLLIDLDIILYKGLWVCKDQYYPGLRACDWIVDRILDRFNYPEFELVISGSGNFRKKISSEYKSNRKPESRPKYLYEAKNYFIKYWNAVLTEGIEADDYIASLHDSCTIIVSNDKDYKQLGGKIYNPFKDELVEITKPEYWFFLQTLIGDSADCVSGLKNPDKLHHKNQPCYTEDTASKLLEDKSPEEMKEIVQEKYKTIYGDGWYERFDTNCRLLWLKRNFADEYFYHI